MSATARPEASEGENWKPKGFLLTGDADGVLLCVVHCALSNSISVNTHSLGMDPGLGLAAPATYGHVGQSFNRSSRGYTKTTSVRHHWLVMHAQVRIKLPLSCLAFL